MPKITRSKISTKRKRTVRSTKRNPKSKCQLCKKGGYQECYDICATDDRDCVSACRNCAMSIKNDVDKLVQCKECKKKCIEIKNQDMALNPHLLKEWMDCGNACDCEFKGVGCPKPETPSYLQQAKSYIFGKKF